MLEQLQDILTDFIELIQRIANIIGATGIYDDAKDLYNKIMEELRDDRCE